MRPCSVTTISGPNKKGNHMHYQKILLSLTGEANERSVVDEAKKLQSFFDATLSVIVVNDPGAGKSHMMMAGLPRIEESDIREQLRRFGYGDRLDDLHLIMVDNENEAEAIARATKGFDLLVMGHHRKGIVMARLKDSTDEHVADRAHCPILLVPIESD